MFGTVNLSNLFGGYKGMPRVFEIEGVIGAGWLHCFHRTESADVYGNDYNSWYTKAGANLNFNFGANRAWTFSLKPSVLWDMNGDIMIPYRFNSNARYEWEGEPHNGKSQMNADHAAVQLEAGITYHFKGSNGERYITFCPYKYSQNDIDALNGQINGLRNQLNGLQGDLDAANARNAQLQRDLDACKKAKQPEPAKAVDPNAKYMNVLVHFKVNKTNITADQQANVERVAMYLKNNPTATVDIKGYASPEGPHDNNIRLANGRAEAVKNMLINKYKIDANRIKAQGCGETDMFQELSWNRVSICELIVKK
jgi:outer membrane protein OmpA-like peptidoglycan-associated protein